MGHAVCAGPTNSAVLIEVPVDHGGDLFFRRGADNRVGDLSVLEDDERRNTLDAILDSGAGGFPRIQLADADSTRILGGDLLDCRGNHVAGRAEGGPEVDEHRLIALNHVRLEI